MAQPPPLPSAARSPRIARWLNLALPGAGLFYMGRRKLGLALALPFLACFLAAFTLFLVAYARYLSAALSDNLLQGDRLEQLGDIFPTRWLIGLACFGGIIQVCSMVLLRRAKSTADAANSSEPAKT